MKNINKYSETIMGDVMEFVTELALDKNVTITKCEFMGDGSYLVEWNEGEQNYEEVSRDTILDILFETELEDCTNCPFASICGDSEIFYGCGVWETEMGEDL